MAVNHPWTAERVHDLRTRLGLSQQAFADRIGCAQGIVSMWESDQRHPKGLYAKALDQLAQDAPQRPQDGR